MEDWRMLFTGPHARSRCAGLVEASRFASAIAEVAAHTGISPDLDLRPQSVTVRITFRESDRITPAQLALAQAIAAVASDLSLAAEPDRLQVVQLWVAHAADVAALAAGGRMVDDSHAPDRWTIASPDNHGVDIAGWADDHDGWASVSG